MIFSYFSPLLYFVADKVKNFNCICYTLNFDRDAFEIPYFHHPITWYGIFFAFGFFVAYFVVLNLFKAHLSHFYKSSQEVKQEAFHLSDRLALFVVLGTVIGARLGHVFFYEWSFYKERPFDIVKVWEGGLASHGGAVGIIIALILLFFLSKKDYPMLTFFTLLDAVTLPAAFVGGCIRIGNFINQEILGTPTTLPWGVLYTHPAQKAPSMPLHPVQLYESLSYFIIFACLLIIWKKRGKKIGDGVISAWFFLLVFGARFFLEFFKLPQSDLFDETNSWNVGQFLSLPFILAGALFLLYHFFLRKKRKQS